MVRGSWSRPGRHSLPDGYRWHRRSAHEELERCVTAALYCILTASPPGRQGTVWSPSGHRWLATCVTRGGLVLSEPHAVNASGWPLPRWLNEEARRDTHRWWPPPGAARVP